MAETARFTLTEDDMVNAARLYARASALRPRTIISLLVLFVVVLLAMSMITGIIFPFNAEKLSQRWMIVLGACFAPYLLVLLINIVVNPLLARRIYRQQRSLHGEVCLTWSDERLAFDSEYGSFAMPWSHFARWAEDKRTFLLFESDRLYRIIPKRALNEVTEPSLRKRLIAIGA